MLDLTDTTSADLSQMISTGAQVASGLVLAADRVLWSSVPYCNSLNVQVPCPSAAKPHGLCLVPRYDGDRGLTKHLNTPPSTEVYLQNEDLALIGPFVVEDGTYTIFPDQPSLSVKLHHGPTKHVLWAERYKHLHIGVAEPQEPKVLTNAQVEGLRAMFTASRSDTPTLSEATNLTAWTSRRPAKSRSSKSSGTTTPTKSLNHFALVDTRGLRCMLEHTASTLLAEFCIACVPPIRPTEACSSRRGSLDKENEGYALVYVHEITLPPLRTSVGTCLTHPHTSSATGHSREHAAERAAAATLRDLVDLGVLPHVGFGGTRDVAVHTQTMHQLEKKNRKLMRALQTAQAVTMELKRQLLLCNEAREELAQKAFKQQDLLFRQQEVLKEQHTTLLQYQKMMHPDVKRYSVRELMEMRNASRSAPPVPDTSELPFVDGLPQQQLQDSASSTAQHETSSSSSQQTKSPDRWSKGVAGKYAARYVERGAAASTSTSS